MLELQAKVLWYLLPHIFCQLTGSEFDTCPCGAAPLGAYHCAAESSFPLSSRRCRQRAYDGTPDYSTVPPWSSDESKWALYALRSKGFAKMPSPVPGSDAHWDSK
jgi:hypothetical protein